MRFKLGRRMTLLNRRPLILRRELVMHLFKHAITWILLAVIVLFGVILGCSIGNPEGTRFVIRAILEIAFQLFLWILAIKFFFFLVDQIFGSPKE
jgi:hypothetical protein